MSTEQIRSEFLNWLAPTWSRETVTDENDVVFVDDWVQGAWIGWQASRAALVVNIDTHSEFEITETI